MRILILLSLLLTACAPTQYAQQPWATHPFQQVHAYCDMQLQRTPWMDVEACMTAYGWKPVY